jgi:putative ABC transport system substrate-binding protein
MNRRQFFLIAVTLSLAGGCRTQPNLGNSPRAGVARIGILDASAAYDAIVSDEIAGLKQGLAELGYVDGKNLLFAPRDSENLELLAQMARELVQLPVDVIVAVGGSPAARIARQATSAIPVVFVEVTDPVGLGLVVSLTNPGGNLTGITQIPLTTVAKQLEFLAQLVPGLSRVGIAFDSTNPAAMLLLKALPPTATALGLQLKAFGVGSAAEVEPALNDALAWSVQAMMILSGPGTLTDADPRLAEFSRQHRIPMSFLSKSHVMAGGLMSYGASHNASGQTAARLVDRILRGAKPADLPVEQPTSFELAINQTTAKAIGITIPPEVAQQVSLWVQ